MRRSEGFTLIELLVVILILGVLLAIAAPSFFGQSGKAHDSAVKQKLAVAARSARAAGGAGGSDAESYETGASLLSKLQAAEPELTLTQGPASAAIQPKTLYIDPGSNDKVVMIHSLSPSGKLITITAPIGSPPAIGGYAATILRDSPRGYWRLDEGQGSRATDFGSGTQDGNFSQTNGRPSGAIADGDVATAFDGAQSQVTYNATEAISPPFSAEAWIWIDPTATGTRYILSNTDGSTSGFGMYVNTSSQAVFFICVTTNGCGAYAISAALTTGAWHYLVGTVTNTTQTTVSLYDDGAFVNNSVVPSSYVPGPPTNNFRVGRYSYSAINWFKGRIDDVALYDQALTPTQIQAHYQAGIKN